MFWLVAERNWVAWSQGDLEKVLSMCNELVVLGQELSCKCFGLYALWFRAWVEWVQSAYDQAVQHCKDAIATYRIYYHSRIIVPLYVLGRVALSRGEMTKAEHCFCEVEI
jgi:uncharacterized membrane protein YcfT